MVEFSHFKSNVCVKQSRVAVPLSPLSGWEIRTSQVFSLCFLFPIYIFVILWVFVRGVLVSGGEGVQRKVVVERKLHVFPARSCLEEFPGMCSHLS